ncbi:MAG: FAD-binding oxidoreductase [Halioglobus sp.]
MMSEPAAGVMQQLRQLLGEKGVRVQADAVLPEVTLLPHSTEEVSGILRICSAAGQALVPLGGRTGLANGHFRTDGEIGLSLERMNAIEEIDTHNRTMTVQAGCILQVAAEAAKEQDLLLPLDFGARGSATIGGNVATNAGGNMVIRYGMLRETVLGLEVVLADGTVVTSLNKMLKNNTGYDIKHWFIGAEGTLGSLPARSCVCGPIPAARTPRCWQWMIFAAVVNLLHWLDGHTAGTLSAFEVMWPDFYDYVTRPGSLHTPPLPHGSAYYVLVETLGSDPEADAESFATVLGQAMEDGLIADAVLTRSQSERNALWEIRDDVLEFFKLGPIIPFDISVTLDAMERFVDDIREGMAKLQEPICVIFGHLGDSNLHVILGSKQHAEFDYQALQELLYRTVERYQGSVSAEHGIGLAKREQLHRSRSAAELQLMIAMKRMLDPHNILNPNKVFAADRIAAD